MGKAADRRLSFPCLDKLNQLLYIIEVIIIAIEAFAMIHNPALLVLLKAIEQLLLSIATCKQTESIRLDFAQQAFLAVLFAFIAMCKPLIL